MVTEELVRVVDLLNKTVTDSGFGPIPSASEVPKGAIRVVEYGEDVASKMG